MITDYNRPGKNLVHEGVGYVFIPSSLRDTFHVYTDANDNVGTITRISLPHAVWDWIAGVVILLNYERQSERRQPRDQQFIPTPTTTRLLNAYADLTSRMIAASGALRQSTFEIEAQALWERWHPQPSGGSSS
jgi:hypothetical protein